MIARTLFWRFRVWLWIALLTVGGTLPPSGARALEPVLPDLTGIVLDRDWAIVLGKALFWDTRVGSNGSACASCHFHAGADVRVTNALSPGLLAQPEPDITFGATEAQAPYAPGETASGAPAGPNYTLVEEDFPFHRLADPADRNSEILISSNDVVSSAGSFGGTLTGTSPVLPDDRCDAPAGEIFYAGPYPARQVEPRNTPTTINAAFNHRNFWDGRAADLFNGVGVFGRSEIDHNPRARIVALEGGRLELQSLELEHASLASQAVGPPLSVLEMSCELRSFADLGRKMLSPARRPLASQAIHPQDSVFGASGPFGDLRDRSGRGLARPHLYRRLIERAFAPQYWRAKGLFVISKDGELVRGEGGYTQMELNFSLFWGVAIMLYESTLISDQSPFDRDELTVAQRRGREIFDASGCAFCHSGDLFSSAAVQQGEAFVPLRPNGANLLDGRSRALRDTGFFNIGVRPTAADVGLGGTDPYGSPLSLARRFLAENPSHPVKRVAVNGAMKTPGLRNVALTPPYFHNGGSATLRQVIEFYARGGDRRDASLIDPSLSGDDTGTGPLGQSPIPVAGDDRGTNAGGIPRTLSLTDEQIDELVEFLKGLTDERVQCDQAPFDHPELPIPTGHLPTDDDRDERADDIVFVLPAVGADGYAPGSGFCIPNAGDLFAPGMHARIGGPLAPPLD